MLFFQIKLDERVLRTDQGLLIRSLAPSDVGVYHCQAVEHGFIQPLLRLSLQVIPAHKVGDILPGPTPADGAGGGVEQSAKRRLWYRDFLSLLDHPDLSSVEEFCDRVWKKERKQKRVKTASGGAGGGAQGRTDGGSNSALQPKASNPQKQQAGPPWLQAGAPVAEKSQNGPKGTQTAGAAGGSQAPKTNNQKTQKGNAAAPLVAGGSRASGQHSAKWRRMQENKKGRNRRTHELQRPPRSV